jgi:hypothetical protein
MALREVENHLINDLILGGAKPDEARRLAVVANLISDADLEIDPIFANSVESLLLRDTAAEPLAKVISLRERREAQMRIPQPPALYAVPAPRLASRRSRLAVRVAVAAAVVLVVGAGVTKVVKAGFDSRSVPEAGRNPNPAQVEPNVVGPRVEKMIASGPIIPSPVQRSFKPSLQKSTSVVGGCPSGRDLNAGALGDSCDAKPGDESATARGKGGNGGSGSGASSTSASKRPYSPPPALENLAPVTPQPPLNLS